MGAQTVASRTLIMAETLLFLTEMLNLPVYDLRGSRIGRLRDAAIVPLVDAARVDRFLVGGGWAWLSIRYDQVRSISLEGICLRDEKLTPYHDDEYMLRLARDLLDQQIIDVNGRKVVRVNDVTFETHVIDDNAGGRYDELRVLEVDVGLRSIFRRLLQGALPPRWIRRLQRPIAPNSIPWEFCNIVEPDPQRRLRLNISHARLEDIHPADLADIVEEMAPDQAADVLGGMEEETSEEILEEMETAPGSEVRELLEFREDTAGGMMTTEFLALPENSRVAGAVAAMKGNEDLLESLNTIFLVDAGGRLNGAVPVARLFIAAGDTLLKQLAADTLIHVSLEEKQDRVTETFDKYNLLSLPVVDEEGRLAGVITADDIISVLRQK